MMHTDPRATLPVRAIARETLKKHPAPKLFCLMRCKALYYYALGLHDPESPVQDVDLSMAMLKVRHHCLSNGLSPSPLGPLAFGPLALLQVARQLHAAYLTM